MLHPDQLRDPNCFKTYTDSKSNKFKIERAKWAGLTPIHSIKREEPFVLACWAQYTPEIAGPTVGTAGGFPRWQITPLETDSRDDRIKVGMPEYFVDGGLITVPFAAAVSLLWPDIDPIGEGTIEWTLTTYRPTTGLTASSGRTEGVERGGSAQVEGLGIREWVNTRFLRSAQTITLPREVTRVCVPDSGYAMTVNLYSGNLIIQAPFVPVSTGSSPDLSVTIAAPLAGVVTQAAVLLMY